MTAQISNPEEIKKIKGALSEISNALIQIQAHKDHIKSIKDNLAEEHKDKLSKKQINKLAKTFHNQTFQEEIAEHEEFEYLYETITQEKA